MTEVKDARTGWSYGVSRNACPPDGAMMSEKLRQALRDREIAKDVKVSGDFVRLYCNGHHRDRRRKPLVSPGAEEGCYRKPLVLCDECAALQVYAEKRRAFCPLEPKPMCKKCPKHCYKDDMRRYVREVMRYSGKKSIQRGRLDLVYHYFF